LKQKIRHDIDQMQHLQNMRFEDSYMDPQGVPFSPVAAALRVRACAALVCSLWLTVEGVGFCHTSGF